ncbi:MAG: HD domain-containing phosphohydrolase [Lachnospiraceae bacterium]
MKKAHIKILIAIVITGLICVFGTLVLSKELVTFQQTHREIMDEHVENREYMAKIKTLLYEHQAVIVNHVLSVDEDANATYIEEEQQLREALTKEVVEFSYRMKGGKREQIYHKVYSDFAAYIHNSETLVAFKNRNETDMAVYYNDNTLKPFIKDINQKLDDLDIMTIEEINKAEEEMQTANELSAFLSMVILVAVVAALAICSFFCIRITYYLDKYKADLEKELIEKNKVIQKENEKMIRLQNGVINSMANLIENRDGETGEHVKRTSAYVGMIARAAREQGLYEDILTEDYIERLVKVAPLHDVGKIVVPDYILMKPGKLTPEEFEEIKKHAPEGRRVIRECFASLDDEEYIQMACDVAGCHHEKWDSSGYAGHLAGEDIPLSARIMAIADVFDALISKRRYKDAFTLEEAFSIIKESSGSHFDPKLTEVFLSIRGQIEEYLSSDVGDSY